MYFSRPHSRDGGPLRRRYGKSYDWLAFGGDTLLHARFSRYPCRASRISIQGYAERSITISPASTHTSLRLSLGIVTSTKHCVVRYLQRPGHGCLLRVNCSTTSRQAPSTSSAAVLSIEKQPGHGRGITLVGWGGSNASPASQILGLKPVLQNNFCSASIISNYEFAHVMKYS